MEKLTDHAPEDIPKILEVLDRIAEDPFIGTPFQTELTEEEKVKLQKLLGQQILDVWYQSFADEEASPLEAIIEFNFGNQWSLELLNPKFSLSSLNNGLEQNDDEIDLAKILKRFSLQSFQFDGGFLQITVQKDRLLEFSAPAWIIQQTSA